MARYGTFNYDDGTLYSVEDAQFPLEEEGIIRVPWVFSDPSTGDEYEFAINPLDASVPDSVRNVTTQYTTGGIPINFEGRPQPGTMSLSGTILSEDHYNAMVDWTRKTKQINVQDDLGRSYWIYITTFNPTRQYVPEYPWRHEYSMEAVVLSWE